MRQSSVHNIRKKYLLFTGLLCTLAGMFVLLITVAGVLGVVMRYVLGHPLAWTDKIAEYCIPVIVMLCAADILARDENIRVDIVIRALNLRLKRLFNCIKELALLLVSLALLISGASMVSFARSFGLYDSGDMGWPLWLLELCMPIGALLMVLAVAINLVIALDTLRNR